MTYVFACADVGFGNCEFEIRDENREELLAFVREHGRNAHRTDVSEFAIEGTMREI